MAEVAAAKAQAPTINRGDLQRITDAPSAVDSFIETIKWLQANHTIKTEQADMAALVIHALEGQRAALEPAIKANLHT